MKKMLTTILLILTTLYLQAATFYISQSGNDITGTGSISQPWATLQYAVTRVTYGNTIHVNAGEYYITSYVSIPVGVSIEGDGVSSRFVCSQTVDYALKLESYSGSYVITNGNQSISYISMDGELRGNKAIGVNFRYNVSIHHCRIENFSTRGIDFYGNRRVTGQKPSSYAANNSFHDNYVRNCGGFTGGSGTNNVAISAQRNFQFYNNEINCLDRGLNLDGDCLGFYDQGYNIGTRVYNSTFRARPYATAGSQFAIEFWNDDDLEIHNCTVEGAIDLGGGNGNILKIYDCIIGYDTACNVASQTKGIQVERGYDSVFIYRNFFKYLGNCIYFTPGENSSSLTNVWVYNNIFKEVGYNAVTASQGWGIRFQTTSALVLIRNINFINNTIKAKKYGGGSTMYGISINEDDGPARLVNVKNNIIEGFDYAAIYFGSGTATNDSVNISNNIFYNCGNGNADRGTAVPTHLTRTGNITLNPLNVSSTDFHLQSASPAINAGINVGLTRDYFDSLYVNSPDIGAVEFFSHNPPIAPGVITYKPVGHINYANFTGEVTDNGGGTILSRGFVYGTSPNPTLSNYVINSGTGMGLFTETVFGLQPNTVYHVRSFVINDSPTAPVSYGVDRIFRTPTYSILYYDGL